MDHRTIRSKTWRAIPFSLILLATLVTGGIALAGVPPAAIPAGISAPPPQGNPASSPNVPMLQGRLSPSSPGGGSAVVTQLNVPERVLDMTQLGLRPIQGSPPTNLSPSGGSIGTQNAFMIVSPDVVSQSTASAIGTLLANFTPAENVNYYLNGSLAGTFVADASGRVAVSANTGPGLGYISFEGIGQTSGKRAGGVAQVLNAAPSAPAYAAAPHSLTSTASGTFYAYGF